MNNKTLCEKYPWLIPHNRWTDMIPEDYNYEYTELDNMPRGWRKAFGEQMCEEINNELLTWSEKDRNGFRIMDIKEKWAFLHFYVNYGTSKLYDIINKYEEKSKRICIRCGAPAAWITRGWYMPFCDDCARKDYKNNKWETKSEFEFEDDYIDINEYYKKED